MRKLASAVWLAVALTATMGLAACEQSKSEATETAPAPKKSLSRPAAMYAGQEDILSVGQASVTADKDGGLLLKAEGAAPAAGYTRATFLPRVNLVSPADGVYEVDVVAERPGAVAAAAPTPITVKGAWAHYPADKLKGVKFISKTNSVVAMLPQG